MTVETLGVATALTLVTATARDAVAMATGMSDLDARIAYTSALNNT
jgi:hypothetical protein